MGSPPIHGKDVPLGSRLKVTTIVEVVPPSKEDLDAVLARWLPPIDADVKTRPWDSPPFLYCQMCEKEIALGIEYYEFGGFKAHKTCVDAARAKYTEVNEAATSPVKRESET
jgi:hypothetical protein